MNYDSLLKINSSCNKSKIYLYYIHDINKKGTRVVNMDLASSNLKYLSNIQYSSNKKNSIFFSIAHSIKNNNVKHYYNSFYNYPCGFYDLILHNDIHYFIFSHLNNKHVLCFFFLYIADEFANNNISNFHFLSTFKPSLQMICKSLRLDIDMLNNFDVFNFDNIKKYVYTNPASILNEISNYVKYMEKNNYYGTQYNILKNLLYVARNICSNHFQLFLGE